jgi:hypothetical protein
MSSTSILQKIMPRGANFSREELDSFLDSVEDILPLSTSQWESVVETHSVRYPDKGRTVDSLKRKFKELHIKRIPTGDPQCPPAVRRAKQLRNAIIKLMDGSDLNSPARGTRTDATGMGGESGESSGGSDNDTDNQDYEDTGVEDEDAPTETIDSSEAPTLDAPTGGQAPWLVGTLQDGYVRNVPLPRVPREQRASPELTAPKAGIPLPGYSRLPAWIPTLPK